MYSYSFDEETYHGRLATREQAIEEAEKSGRKPFWTGETRPPSPTLDSAFCYEDLAELVSCQDDYCCDAAEDWDESTKEQRKELEDAVRNVIREWIERHKLQPRFWMIKDGTEIKH